MALEIAQKLNLGSYIFVFFQVPPAELEDLIRGHEKVLDVAVIGVPHEK